MEQKRWRRREGSSVRKRKKHEPDLLLSYFFQISSNSLRAEVSIWRWKKEDEEQKFGLHLCVIRRDGFMPKFLQWLFPWVCLVMSQGSVEADQKVAETEKINYVGLFVVNNIPFETKFTESALLDASSSS
jgi:hypothetical protein